MNARTTEDFQRHFDQLLEDRKPQTLRALQTNAFSLQDEIENMSIAATTLINEYRIIHADDDPIDSVQLTRIALESLRRYAGALEHATRGELPA